MAGDIGIREQILILPSGGLAAEAAPSVVRSLSRGSGRIMHQYGERVLLAEVPPGAEGSIAFESMSTGAAYDTASVPGDLTETEQLGVGAFEMRQTAEYARAKANRPHQGASWEGPEGVQPLSCVDVGKPGVQAHAEGALAMEAGAPALSARLTGKPPVSDKLPPG